MVALLAALFVFLALALTAIWYTERHTVSRTERRIRSLRSPVKATAKDPSILLQFSSIPILRDWLSTNASAQRLRLDLERANVRLRVGEYLLGRALIGIILFVLTILFVGPGLIALAIGGVLLLVGVMLPAVWLKVLRQRRLAAIEGQLVETLTLIANALRSGFGLVQGLQAAARQMTPPMSEELDRVIQNTNLGVSTEEALLDLGRRVGSDDLDMAITAVVIQRTTGGNLAEILDNVAQTIREREIVRGEIKTLTAEKRMSGNVLSVYPAALAAVMFLIRPTLMSVLITETVGWVLIGIALTLQITGFILIRRIVSIDI